MSIAFFLTALVYSSVGFGGGSTYLALLALFQVDYLSLPKIALLCNLVVVSQGLYHYAKTKNLRLMLCLPWVVASVPMAYLGGRLELSKNLFLFLLGFSLLIAGARLFFSEKMEGLRKQRSHQTLWGIGVPVGGLLGFLSGMVGIGGGIFLSPLLYFLGWGTAKQIAAGASFFIFVNSISGLLGQASKSFGDFQGGLLLPLLAAVILGGQIGSRLSVRKISPFVLQRITGILVLVVAVQIFWRLV